VSEADIRHVTTVSIIACAVAAWAVFRKCWGSVLVAHARRFVPPAGLLRCSLWALGPAFGAQILLLRAQVRYENGPPLTLWMQRLPLPIFDNHTESSSLHQLFVSLGFAVAAVEVVLLAILAAGVEAGVRGAERRPLTVVFCLLATLAVVAPAMSTTDPYEFVAAGMLGFGAYAPPHGAFAGTAYAAIYPHIPMEGVIYGPLWLSIDTATTFFAPTILAKLIALRLLNALLLVGLIAALRWARVPRTALALVAVNPALWFYVVLNPHADIEGLFAAVAALGFAQRNKRAAATLLVIAAGLIKFPFVIAGAAAFAPLASVRLRLALWSAAVGAVLLASYLFGGPRMLQGLLHQAGNYANRAHASGGDEHVWMIPVACALMLAFVVFRFGVAGLAWLFAQLSPLAEPWYLLWGLPFALASRTLVVFLVPLPLLTAMRAPDLLGSHVPDYLAVAVIGVALVDSYVTLRRRPATLARA